MKLEKKAWPELFQEVLNGTKNFDLRLADFSCKPGDILVLREFDPKTQKYTGRALEKKITHVLKTKDQTFWSSEDVEKFGFQVLGLK
jgi:hypothetical protein